MYDARIHKQAKELGIDTNGKDLREISHEVREKTILQAAQKLGIETKNKSTQEIFNEIITNHADKVKELNLFPAERGNWHFFHGHKGK
ncbi:hypothetical protein NDK43_08495 [Neobacillus pocheonensis]|uniref:Uncharacterized protein n=1 Tax=Neobacillus pocheonensis TaxID=363869 RepID=A0ABT0W7W8_9BACI|nr:hypothetical protein [Neobacillus pocheonensis]